MSLMDIKVLKEELVESFGSVRVTTIECLGHLERLPMRFEMRRQGFAHNLGDRTALMARELLKLALE